MNTQSLVLETADFILARDKHNMMKDFNFWRVLSCKHGGYHMYKEGIE